MARGFDSKSVEEQQAEYEAKRNRPARTQVSADEAALRRERESLELSRRQVEGQLRAATAARHRQMLEQALAELDQRLAKLKISTGPAKE